MGDTLKPFVRLYVIALILAVTLFLIFKVSPTITCSVIGCWPLLGSIITNDDDLPGGWSNPDGDEPFPWVMYRAFAVFLVVMIITGEALSFILNMF